MEHKTYHGRPVIWSPQPRQAAFMARTEDEALYGGAAGGGKSDALIIEALRQVHIPHYRALILRKTYPQLSELIDKTMRYYKPVFPKARYNGSSHCWTFPSGAKIYFGSLNHTQDKYNYQGKAFDFIGVDELTHFTWDEYSYVMSRNRPSGPGTRVYIRATANPGGVGHAYIKRLFIDRRFEDGEQPEDYAFIPARVTDNAALLARQPDYLKTLEALPYKLRRAWLEGRWDVFAGQVFQEFTDDPDHYDDRRWTHVIRPFDVPREWNIYRSYDFGYARPFSCGWWAVDHDGCVYRIAELYGCTGTPDEGVLWTPERQFAEIRRVEEEHPLLRGRSIQGVADPAIWDASRGESIYETALKHRIFFAKGDNRRIAGWMQMHYRMSFDGEGYPMLYVFQHCRAFIRTIPQLLYSETVPEDVDTTQEDHVADESRYFCMTRPIAPVRAEAREIAEDPLDLRSGRFGSWGGVRRI